MNIERFKHAYKVVSAVPEDRMALEVWRKSCGTIACAAGWCTQDPEFNQQGFGMLGAHAGAFSGMPTYDTAEGFTALAWFFDIPWDDANYLFGQRDVEDDEAFGDKASDLVVWKGRMQEYAKRHGVELC